MEKKRRSAERRRPETPEEQRKRRRKRSARRKKLIPVAIILAVLGFAFFSLYRIVDLKLEQKELLAQQEKLEQQKKELDSQLEDSDDPELIESKARELLNMIMPGESLYVLPDDGKTGE